MGQQGKLATLEAMKALVHSIDSRHYERLREKSRSKKNKPDKDRSDKDKSDKKPGNQNSGNNSGKPEIPPHSPTSSERTESSPRRSANAILKTTSVCSVAEPDTLPRIVDRKSVV